jgi:hypothetical protein
MRSEDRLEIDLNKSWDGINFCLKKRVPQKVPHLFQDVKCIDGIEVGYGPATHFLSGDVIIIADAYSKIPVAYLLSSYNPKKMKGVYPDGLWIQESKDI